jgi:hypothetical protein
MLARWAGRAALLALVMAVTVVSAAAETLMMPKRDARKGVQVVVWGITTQASGATCSLDFGDATAVQNCTGADRSYKAYTHIYATSGIYTATLTVGTEVATAVVTVFDPALLPGGVAGDNNRSLGINMAIQDGLRHMWYSHATRTTFDTNTQAFWNNHYSETALVVLAFQNHGYSLPSSPTVQPTGLYEKYVVRRGLNHVIANLSTITINTQQAGDPRVAGLGVSAGDSTALTAPGSAGYTSAIAMLPFAGSGALSRVSTEVAGYTNGKTFGEILQRVSNGLAWGQLDAGHGPHARGSWFYNYNSGYHDGSTVGWDVLAFLAAEAAGATVPGFVKTEFQFTLDCHIKPDGSWNYGHYQTCTNTSSDYPTIEKGGIPLQGMAWTGNSTQAPSVISWIDSKWNGGTTWICPPNYGCGYAMFNNFKGLKLQGVNTLSNVNRSTRAWKFLGTTGVEDDWYADYQDYLVYTQSNPTSTTGGNWPGMQLSANLTGGWGSAIAELILSPVALVLPDADKFGAVGLTPATNSALEQTTHTVTAHAESTGGTPVPGATVTFTVLTGPNAGMTGTGTTNSSGEATFTYTDAGPVGTTGVDTIQAAIGTLTSNIVNMTWTPLNAPPNAVDDSASTFSGTPVSVGVVGNDGDPDFDLLTVTAFTQGANGSVVDNGDGSVTYSPVAGFAGTDTFTYTISDGKGGTDTATVTITVTKRSLTVSADSYTRSYLAVDPAFAGTLTGVASGDNITATYTSPGAGSQVPGVYATIPTLVDPDGKLVNYTVASTNGTLTITNTAPVCTIAPSVTSIWPPNHKLVSVTASGATDVDGGPLTYSVVSIFQDEPTNTTGDGNTAIDGFGVGTSTAQVRAERVGDPKTPGNGRVYHITFSVTDSLGLTCQSTVQVGVPHDQSGKVQPIDGGPIYNSTVAGPAPAVAAKGKGN